MFKYLVFIFFSLAICFMAGCVNVSPSPDSILGETKTFIPGPTRSPAKTNQTSVAISTPSKTATSLSVSSTPTPVPISTLEASLKVACVTIVPSLPSEVEITGQVVLGGYGAYSFIGQPNPLLLNLHTREETPLASQKDEQLGFVKVSPNHQWLVYKKYSPRSDNAQLVVVGADGQHRETIAWEESWNSIVQWLGDENLLIEALPHTLIKLDPFTGERQELPADYPGIYDIFPGPAWEEFSLTPVIYEVTLRRTIYPKSNGELSGVVLWDNQTGQEIIYVTGTVGFGYRPQWSPDGQQFVINNSLTSYGVLDRVIDQEIYSVSLSGEVTRLTYLTSTYPRVEFGHYEWSPDGNRLAFWLEVGPLEYSETYAQLEFAPEQMMWRLAVLDFATGDVVNYCLPAGYPLAPLVWSADSKQIAVQIAPELSRRPTFVVDLQHGIAVEITDDMFEPPTGWMKTAP